MHFRLGVSESTYDHCSRASWELFRGSDNLLLEKLEFLNIRESNREALACGVSFDSKPGAASGPRVFCVAAVPNYSLPLGGSLLLRKRDLP
jgi:hypothetical protein